MSYILPIGQKRPRNVFWDTFVFFEKKEYSWLYKFSMSLPWYIKNHM